MATYKEAAIRLLDEKNAEIARLRAVIKQLVDLKGHKDKCGKSTFYLREQPLAWQAARKALDNEEDNKENARLRAELEALKTDRGGYILIANRSDKYERRR